MTRAASGIVGFFRSEGFMEYLSSLHYCLFTMRRPLVGFWDLIHEKRGSMAAAHTLVFLAVLVQIMRLTLTNFQFFTVYLEAFNLFFVVSSIVLPILLWTVANWCLTTLWDGKGRLGDIYMGTAYALAPMTIIWAVLIPISHIITFEEGMVYWTATGIGSTWTMVLVICAMMEIHDYTMSKTILSSLCTVIAIGVMVFVFVMFFAVISDGVAYFVSLARELLFRLR